MLIQQLNRNYKIVRNSQGTSAQGLKLIFLVQSQLKLTEQLHEQTRIELNKQIHERTQENAETTAHIFELTTKIVRQNYSNLLY